MQLLTEWAKPFAGSHDKILSGELKEIELDHRIVLYMQRWNGRNPYVLVYGYKESDLRPNGRTFEVDIEIIEVEDARESARTLIRSKADGPIIFYEDLYKERE